METFKTDTDEQTRHRQSLIQVKKREAYLELARRAKEAEQPMDPSRLPLNAQTSDG